jgi:hypothetical protein
MQRSLMGHLRQLYLYMVSQFNRARCSPGLAGRDTQAMEDRVGGLVEARPDEGEAQLADLKEV